jgi:hypothetical protein
LEDQVDPLLLQSIALVKEAVRNCFGHVAIFKKHELKFNGPEDRFSDVVYPSLRDYEGQHKLLLDPALHCKDERHGLPTLATEEAVIQSLGSFFDDFFTEMDLHLNTSESLFEQQGLQDDSAWESERQNLYWQYDESTEKVGAAHVNFVDAFEDIKTELFQFMTYPPGPLDQIVPFMSPVVEESIKMFVEAYMQAVKVLDLDLWKSYEQSRYWERLAFYYSEEDRLETERLQAEAYNSIGVSESPMPKDFSLEQFLYPMPDQTAKDTAVEEAPIHEPNEGCENVACNTDPIDSQQQSK